MEKKIRIGHVGTKHDHSEAKLQSILQYPDIFEVVGLVEHDPAQLEAIRDIPTYRDIPRMTDEQLLNAGIDAVLVEGYEKDLTREAMPYIENGVHIHLDKPAGPDVDTFRTLLQKAKKQDLAVQLAYMYRYNPAFLDLQELIRQGRLGDILSVRAIMNTGHPTERRRWLERFDAGDMYYLGCHMVDFIYNLQGVPNAVIPYLKRTGYEGAKSVDHGIVLYDYDTGISVAEAVSTELNGYGRRQLVVSGTEGTYEILSLEPYRARFTERSFANTYHNEAVERQIYEEPGHGRYGQMMLDFARMVRGEKENPYTYDYELELQKLVMASCGEETDFHNVEHI